MKIEFILMKSFQVCDNLLESTFLIYTQIIMTFSLRNMIMYVIHMRYKIYCYSGGVCVCDLSLYFILEK